MSFELQAQVGQKEWQRRHRCLGTEGSGPGSRGNLSSRWHRDQLWGDSRREAAAVPYIPESVGTLSFHTVSPRRQLVSGPFPLPPPDPALPPPAALCCGAAHPGSPDLRRQHHPSLPLHEAHTVVPTSSLTPSPARTHRSPPRCWETTPVAPFSPGVTPQSPAWLSGHVRRGPRLAFHSGPTGPCTPATLPSRPQPRTPPLRVPPAPAHPPLAPGSLQLLPGPRPSAGPQRTTSLICLPRVFCGTPAAARRAPGRPRHCREWRPRLHSWLGRGEEDPGAPDQAVRAGSPPCAPCARRALSAAVAPFPSPSPGAALAPAAPTPPPGCSPSRASKLLGVDVRRTSSQASTGLPAPKHPEPQAVGKAEGAAPPMCCQLRLAARTQRTEIPPFLAAKQLDGV